MEVSSLGIQRRPVWVIVVGLAFFCCGGLAAMSLLKNQASPTSGSSGWSGANDQDNAKEGEYEVDGKRETATFGAGCFWCVEAIFQQLDGVMSVTSGFSGGDVENPTYQQVISGTTGHAEVCRIVFDPDRISYEMLLEVFWKTHDPTTLNRQGNDVGTQYRSAIFYHSQQQRELAELYKRRLDESGAFDRPIVTEITQFTAFYPAEDYHQNYFRNNPDEAYCRAVIRPKVEKFREVFADRLKRDAEAGVGR